MDTPSSPDHVRYTVLRHLFRRANKHSTCPSCLASRLRYDKVKDHCDGEGKKGDEIHKRLIAEDFPTFHTAYAEAIGWKDPKGGLRLPYSRSACFDLDTVIGFKLRTSGGSEFDLLLQAAEKSAMGYICPYELATFNSMSSLRDHCQKNKDQTHRNLASLSTSHFIDSYTSVMGREIKSLPLGFGRPGPPSPHECLKTSFVLKEMKTEKLIDWYNENKGERLPVLCI